MPEIWTGLLPVTSDARLHRQAELVIVTCLFLIAILTALVAFWRLTQDLEIKTVLGFSGLGLLLAGLIALAHAGQAAAAAWALAGGMLALVTVIVGLYGTDGPVMAWYLVPILVLAGIAGAGAALGAALFATAVIWLSALAQQAGRYTPPWSELPFHHMYVTFNAPTMTALYLLTALVAGVFFTP